MRAERSVAAGQLAITWRHELTNAAAPAWTGRSVSARAGAMVLLDGAGFDTRQHSAPRSSAKFGPGRPVMLGRYTLDRVDRGRSPAPRPDRESGGKHTPDHGSTS